MNRIARFFKKIKRDFENAGKTVRKPPARRAGARRQAEESGDGFTTQLSVCVILIVFVFAVSKMNFAAAINFTQDLKSAVAKQTSVETMKQTAQSGFNKADSLADKILKIIGIKNNQDSPEVTTEPVTDSGAVTEPQTISFPNETLPDEAVEPAVMEEVGVGKEEAPEITPSGP